MAGGPVGEPALGPVAFMSEMNTIYGWFEALHVESALLQTDAVIEGPAADVKDPVSGLW